MCLLTNARLLLCRSALRGVFLQGCPIWASSAEKSMAPCHHTLLGWAALHCPRLVCSYQACSYQAAGAETHRCVSCTRLRPSHVHHLHRARPARHPLLAAGHCAHQHVGRLRQRVLQHHVRAQPQRHAGRLADARARKQLLRELEVDLGLRAQAARFPPRGRHRCCKVFPCHLQGKVE